MNGLLGKGEAGPVALGYSFGPGWPERQLAWHMVVVLVACSNGPERACKKGSRASKMNPQK